MRLFFAGETSRKQALELLYAYRAQCLADLDEMEKANQQFSKIEKLYPAEELIYTRLIMMNGDMMRQTRLAWVEKAIEMLEGKRK